MVTNPIGDFLTRIKNAVMAHNREVHAPYSKMKGAVAEVLKKEGYLDETKKVGNKLVVVIAYKNRKPIITGVKNTSRPGMRIYRKNTELPRPLGGAGIALVSTSKGIMTDRQARQKKLGGEVLGEVW